MPMAGLDGIKNKIHPGDPMDKDLYELPKEELKMIPTVCGSLREALENLDKDREYLLAGGVFDNDQHDIDPNTGWPNVNTTRITKNNMKVSSTGELIVLAARPGIASTNKSTISPKSGSSARLEYKYSVSTVGIDIKDCPLR